MSRLNSLFQTVIPSVTEMLVFILVVVPMTFALFYYFKRQRKVRLINKLPGPKTVPILGNGLDFNVEAKEVFKRFIQFCDQNTSAPAVRLWIGLKPVILVYKPSVAEVILSNSKYIDKSDFYAFLHPWLGLSLLTETGKVWQQRRKMLTPSFHFSILEDFIISFNKQASIFVNNLESNADGRIFDIFTNVTLCTLDVIMETAMGRSINAQDNSESDYVKALYKISQILYTRIFKPWMQPELLFKLLGYAKEQEECLKILHDFTIETIQEKKKAYQEQKNKNEEEVIDGPAGKKKHLAFLDLLLQHSEGSNALTDEQLRAEVDTFMFEGHDTTAASITWCIYLLGETSEMQEKVFEELDNIFGDSKRDATVSDLREMKFLECCIKESLRIFPSVPMFGRELLVDVNIEGYTIPAGTNAMFIPYSLHRNASQFPDPEKFQPERFLPENASKLHPYAYIPFSAGPRNCIGQRFALMEEKTILSSFFRKYKVESVTPRKDLHLLGDLIMRPEGGTLVKLSIRN